MTRRQIGQIALKVTADGGGRVLLLGLFALAARTLPPLEFGLYAFALALGAILAQLSESGLQVMLLRRLSATTGRPSADAGARTALGSALGARLAVALPLSVIGLGLVATTGGSAVRIGALTLIAIAIVVSSFADVWAQVLRAEQRVDIEALVSLGARVGLTVLGGLALLSNGSLMALSLAYAASAAASVVLAVAVGSRYLKPSLPGPWRQQLARVRLALREAFPLAVGGIASLLMFRVDVLLLQWLRGPADVAAYAPAFRLFEATLLFPVAVMAIVLPMLSRISTDSAAVERLVLRATAVLLAAGLVVTLAGWALGATVIAVAFGMEYVSSAQILQVLLISVPLMFVNAVLTVALIVRGLLWWEAVAMIGALIANVGINLLLIPALGPLGAAIATVSAEVVLLALCVAGLRRAPALGPRAAQLDQGR